MDHHSYSFFGQKTGLILDSSNLNEPSIYLQFLKIKSNGSWEKPSKKEGKNIKLNLLEIIQLINVVGKENAKWSTVHRFNNETTSIFVQNNSGMVNIKIADYGKLLKYPESKLFYDLLIHIYQEKIENATSSYQKSNNFIKKKEILSKKENNDIISLENHNVTEKINNQSIDMIKTKEKNNENEFSKLIDNSNENYFSGILWYNTLEKKNDFVLVPGSITSERDKAISFQILGHNKIWVPKSCLESNYISKPQNSSKIWIKEWFIKKKVEDIFA